MRKWPLSEVECIIQNMARSGLVDYPELVNSAHKIGSCCFQKLYIVNKVAL